MGVVWRGSREENAWVWVLTKPSWDGLLRVIGARRFSGHRGFDRLPDDLDDAVQRCLGRHQRRRENQCVAAGGRTVSTAALASCQAAFRELGHHLGTQAE